MIREKKKYKKERLVSPSRFLLDFSFLVPVALNDGTKHQRTGNIRNVHTRTLFHVCTYVCTRLVTLIANNKCI